MEVATTGSPEVAATAGFSGSPATSAKGTGPSFSSVLGEVSDRPQAADSRTPKEDPGNHVTSSRSTSDESSSDSADQTEDPVAGNVAAMMVPLLAGLVAQVKVVTDGVPDTQDPAPISAVGGVQAGGVGATQPAGSALPESSSAPLVMASVADTVADSPRTGQGQGAVGDGSASRGTSSDSLRMAGPAAQSGGAQAASMVETATIGEGAENGVASPYGVATTQASQGQSSAGAATSVPAGGPGTTAPGTGTGGDAVAVASPAEMDSKEATPRAGGVPARDGAGKDTVAQEVETSVAKDAPAGSEGPGQKSGNLVAATAAARGATGTTSANGDAVESPAALADRGTGASNATNAGGRTSSRGEGEGDAEKRGSGQEGASKGSSVNPAMSPPSRSMTSEAKGEQSGGPASVESKDRGDAQAASVSGMKAGEASSSNVVASRETGRSESTQNSQGSLFDQLLSHAAKLSLPTNSSLRVQLKPASLGYLDLRLGLSDGVLTLQIFAESDRTRDMIQGAIPQLRQALEGKAIEVGQMSLGSLLDASGGWQNGSSAFSGPGQWPGGRRYSRVGSEPPVSPEPLVAKVGSRGSPAPQHLVDYRV